MTTKALHSELQGMVRRGQLSEAKISELVRLKETVERFASCPYVSNDEIANLEQRYGAKPSIITWGDYFQTEIASRHFALNDQEFSRIIDTIRFDLIAALKIFQNKPKLFFKMVQEDGLAVQAKPQDTWTPEDEQKAHMYILAQYFIEMGLEEMELKPIDEKWFENFLPTQTYVAK